VVNANVFARGSLTSALIANAMLTVRTEHRLEAYAIWTFTEDHIGNSAPKGLENSAQGFNPGNRHPERCALKGRQIKRTSNTAAESIFRLAGRGYWAVQPPSIRISVPVMKAASSEHR
jgi:hypothetical protein